MGAELDAENRARLLEQALHKVLDERERGIRGDTMTIEGGVGKWWARLRGTTERFVALMVIVISMGFVGYVLHLHDKAQAASIERLEQSNRASNERVEKAMRESNEIQQAQLWILTLNEKDRMKLNLTRPKKITEMQR